MTLLVVETLTVSTWWRVVWPHLLRRLSRTRGLRCGVIEGSRPGWWIARLMGRLIGVRIEPLRFRLAELRDDDGVALRLRIASQDLTEVQSAILSQPEFRRWVPSAYSCGRLETFLSKQATVASFERRGTTGRALLLIHVCRWWRRQDAHAAGETWLVLDWRPWADVLIRHAQRYGVNALVAPPQTPLQVQAMVRRWLGPVGVGRLRAVVDRLAWWWSATRRGAAPDDPTAGRPDPAPRVAVEYYGQLNLNAPERYSDLFFWQAAPLPPGRLVVTFDHSIDPLDAEKREELSAHGIAAMAMGPRATTLPDGPVFLPRFNRPAIAVPLPQGGRAHALERRWWKEQVGEYARLRAFWEEAFAMMGVKIFVSWYKYDATHCAIADALEQLGGVTAIYQRAYESHPSAGTAIAADLAFGFSSAMADVERQAHSRIRYHVATGYLGDHRFPRLRQPAAGIRQALHQGGAQRCVAYSDENSWDDGRWMLDHELMRSDYAFLLEKVLEEPWLGLILKPKVPRTLRQRLGPVAELLSRAQATGRCVVYQEGLIHGAYPPAAAALAADVMVHGRLAAATAGLEAALAGVPTLLMDRDGWPVSPLYRLGVGRVVFTDWAQLWQACLDAWRRPGSMPGFGDWSPLLDELDPFRDGRAAQRMGTYLQWLLEGFDAKLPRETVMADAAQRYADRWGQDKVTSVNQDEARERLVIEGTCLARA